MDSRLRRVIGGERNFGLSGRAGRGAALCKQRAMAYERESSSLAACALVVLQPHVEQLVRAPQPQKRPHNAPYRL